MVQQTNHLPERVDRCRVGHLKEELRRRAHPVRVPIVEVEHAVGDHRVGVANLRSANFLTVEFGCEAAGGEVVAGGEERGGKFRGSPDLVSAGVALAIL